MILESWKKIEETFGEAQHIMSINQRQPNRVKRKVKIVIAEGDIQEEAGIHLLHNIV